MKNLHRWIAVVSGALVLGACTDSLDLDSATQVVVTTPAWRSVLAGTTTLAATTGGDAPVTGVRFVLEGTILSPEDTAPPFEIELDTRAWPNGDYFLEAQARTADGHLHRSQKVFVSIFNVGALRMRVSVPPGAEGPKASTLTLDGQPVGDIPVDGGTVELTDLEAGRHWVDLIQARYDCTTVPGVATAVDVLADDTVDVELDVECSAVPNLEIAFAANGDIYRSRLDGSGLVNLTQSSDRTEASPDWSPDGSRLAYVAGREIVVADADGADETPLNLPKGDKRGPRWSPDGTRILFANDPQTWVVERGDYCWYVICWFHRLHIAAVDGADDLVSLDADGGALDFDDLPGGWSPDGSQVVYEREGAPCTLYVADASGGPDTRSSPWSGCGLGSADWGPDDRIAFIAWSLGGGDLATVNPDGTGIAVLQSSLAYEHNPRWTSDGQWIVLLVDGRITVTRADGFGRYRALRDVGADGLAVRP